MFSYDKQGNLVNKKEVLQGGTYFTNYTYDGKNRLETVNNNDEISASYTYRYDGLRHSKTVDGETKYFTYNGGNITSELTSSGTYNYYRGSSMIGIKDPAGEKYYFTQNNKGDIISLKDATGNPVDTYSYDAFGNKNEDTEKLYFQGEWEKETSQVYNPFGYSGEYFDEETGFVYLRGRYYDPATERFITEDPTKDGANWYAYCGNDPVNYIDPSGLLRVTDGQNTYERVYNNQKKKYTDYYVCKGTSGLSKGNPDKNSGYKAGNVSISKGSTVKGSNSTGADAPHKTSVQLPDGRKVKAIIRNSITYLYDGSRPPKGSTIDTLNGKYVMSGAGEGMPMDAYLKSAGGTMLGISGELQKTSTQLAKGNTKVTAYPALEKLGKASTIYTVLNDTVTTITEDSGNSRNQRLIKISIQAGGTAVNTFTSSVTARSAMITGTAGASYIGPVASYSISWSAAIYVDKKVQDQVEAIQDKLYEKYNIN